MSTQLPKGWVETEIKDVAFTQSGGTPKTSRKDYWNGNVPWINSGKLKDTIIDEPSRYITELGLKESSARLFPKDSVVIALTGATTGKVGYLGFETSTNQSVTGIFPNNFYNSKLLFYQLISLRDKILTHALGTAQPHINKRIVDETLIKFPPLAEQKRIADKLDTLYGHMDKINAGLERIPELLKKFRQQVLTQAVTGKLTEDWREGKELTPYLEQSAENTINFDLPYTWVLAPIHMLAKCISGYAFKSNEFVSDGIPLIRMGNLYQDKLDMTRNPVFVDAHTDKRILNKYSAIEGDILLSLTGTKYKRDYGFAIYVPKEASGSLVNQRILCLRPSIEANFLLYLLRSEIFREQFFSLETGGVNQGNVSSKGVEKIIVPVPSPKEQREIVKRVDALFKVADAIEKQYHTLQQKAAALPQAILSKAFRGELVPQNPNDEPATELLKRIQTMKNKS